MPPNSNSKEHNVSSHVLQSDPTHRHSIKAV